MPIKTQFSDHHFQDCQYFMGVVEDRDDPLKLGRLKVRCYGVHTDIKSDISTDDLPWAVPIMPITSASISGVGTSPTGPVEGTWVFGFFMDGIDLSQPFILGTLVGAPTDKPNTTYGFSDPNGVYPKIIEPGESDVNKLARGNDINTVGYSSVYAGRAGEHNLANKKEHREIKIPTAVPPQVKSIQDGPPSGKNPNIYWERNYYNEPNPRYGGQVGGEKDPINLREVNHKKASPEYGGESKYPLNHVNVTESGHIFEVDDSPGAGRFHKYHNSGTFEEIQPNGTRVTKVVGDDYEVVMCDKNMVVSGNVNITVNNADLRLYVHKDPKDDTGGDMYVEVDGNYNLNVKGNYTQKVQGTKHTEVLSDMATNVNKNKSLRVGVDKTTLIGNNFTEDIGGDEEKTITGHEQHYVFSDSFKTVTSETAIMSGDNITFGTGNNLNIRAVSNVNIDATEGLLANTGTTMDINAVQSIDIDSNTIISITAPTEVEINSDTEVDINAGIINLN